MDKRGWRRRLRAARAALPPGERAAKAQRMVDHFFSLPEIARAGSLNVLLYAAAGSEAPTKPLAGRLLRAGHRVFLPRLDRERPGEMDVVPVSSWDELVPGPYFGIPQPPPDVPPVPPESLDAVVVPAVGFDRNGRRLGQGGGYYDRFFARLPRRILRIGWAFSVQVVDELPSEKHDQGVDLIVTEAGVVRPPGPPGLSAPRPS